MPKCAERDPERINEHWYEDCDDGTEMCANCGHTRKIIPRREEARVSVSESYWKSVEKRAKSPEYQSAFEVFFGNSQPTIDHTADHNAPQP